MNLKQTAEELVAVSQAAIHQNSDLRGSTGMVYAQTKCTQATLDALMQVLLARGFVTKAEIDAQSLKSFQREIDGIRGPGIILPRALNGAKP